MLRVMFFFFHFVPGSQGQEHANSSEYQIVDETNAQSESSHNFTYKYVPSSLMLILANFVEWTMPFAVWIASSFLACRNIFFPAERELSSIMCKEASLSTLYILSFDVVIGFGVWMRALLRSESSIVSCGALSEFPRFVSCPLFLVLCPITAFILQVRRVGIPVLPYSNPRSLSQTRRVCE